MCTTFRQELKEATVENKAYCRIAILPLQHGKDFHGMVMKAGGKELLTFPINSIRFRFPTEWRTGQRNRTQAAKFSLAIVAWSNEKANDLFPYTQGWKEDMEEWFRKHCPNTRMQITWHINLTLLPPGRNMGTQDYETRRLAERIPGLFPHTITKLIPLITPRPQEEDQQNNGHNEPANKEQVKQTMEGTRLPQTMLWRGFVPATLRSTLQGLGYTAKQSKKLKALIQTQHAARVPAQWKERQQLKPQDNSQKRTTQSRKRPHHNMEQTSMNKITPKRIVKPQHNTRETRNFQTHPGKWAWQIYPTHICDLCNGMKTAKHQCQPLQKAFIQARKIITSQTTMPFVIPPSPKGIG